MKDRSQILDQIIFWEKKIKEINEEMSNCNNKKRFWTLRDMVDQLEKCIKILKIYLDDQRLYKQLFNWLMQ